MVTKVTNKDSDLQLVRNQQQNLDAGQPSEIRSEDGLIVNMCILCKTAAESVQHLFHECEYTTRPYRERCARTFRNTSKDPDDLLQEIIW